MGKTKTIGEWIKIGLSPADQEKAKANLKQMKKNHQLDIKEDSLSSAILGLFTWEESKEGFKYWSNLYYAAWDREEEKDDN